MNNMINYTKIFKQLFTQIQKFIHQSFISKMEKRSIYSAWNNYLRMKNALRIIEQQNEYYFESLIVNRSAGYIKYKCHMLED